MNHPAGLSLFSLLHHIAKHPLCLALCLLLYSLGTLASAADQSVTNTAASGPGSLPQAVADVGTGENVIFESAVAGQTITLSSDLDINRSMNFTNNTGNKVTVDLVDRFHGVLIDEGCAISLDSGLTFQNTGTNYTATVFGYDGYTINGFNGTVKAISSSGSAYGVYSYHGDIDITNGLAGTIEANGVNYTAGICCDSGDFVRIAGGLSGTIIANSPSNCAMGITAVNEVSITGGMSGSISVSSSDGSPYAIGIRCGAGNLNIAGGFSGTINANATDGQACGASVFKQISIENGLSGTIAATSLQGYAYGLLGRNINITGGLSGDITISGANRSAGLWSPNDIGITDVSIIGSLSGNITAISESNKAYGIWSGNINITDSLSGNIKAKANNDEAYGMHAEKNINGGNAGKPLIITGSVMAETNANERTAAIQGCGINLKLEKEGTLSAISKGGSAYAIFSVGTETDRVELVAGCTVIGDVDLGGGASDVMTLSGTTGTTTYNGDISGVETLSVTGGNWRLNGQIGCDLNISGGGLGGTAQINNLVNNGTLAPGNSIGTLSIGGNYTQNAGSTLEIEINDAGQSDLVDVAGEARINGGMVDIQAESGTYTLGQTYTVLDASNGVNGTFDSVIDNLFFLDAALICNANSVQVQLIDRVPYVAGVQTPNQQAVASYLDSHYVSTAGDFTSVLIALNGINAQQRYAAFDSLSGELYGSLATVGIENTDRFLRTIALRLRAKSFSGMFQYSAPEPVERGDSEENEVARGQDTFAGGVRVNRWLPWAEGYGVGATIANDGNASGLDYSVGGVTYGFEDELDEHTLFGFVAGYSKTFTNLDTRRDHGEIKSTQAGVYMNHHSQLGYATGIAAYGYNAYDTWRHVQIGSLARLARAKYEGNEFSFYFETGRNYQCRSVFLQPFAALQYIQLHQNSFGETGADSVNIEIDGIGADSFRSLFGTRVMGSWQADFGRTLTLEGRAMWRHEFLGGARVVDAQFTGQPGSSFAISGLTIDRDAALLGGGLTYSLSQDAKVYANYDLLFSKNYAAHAGSAGLMLAW